MPAIPLALAVPAAAASLAYLNARWSAFYDYSLLSALVRTHIRLRLAARRDRLSLFYKLEQHATTPSTSNHPFLVYENQTWTFREVYDTSLRYGQYLKNEHGVKKGEIVAMDFMNSAAFVFVWMGLWSIGASPAFINYNLANVSLEHCVKMSSARLLLVDEEVYREKFSEEVLRKFGDEGFRDGEGGGKVEVVVYDKGFEERALRAESVREKDECRTGVVGSDIAMLIYTSGTTGLPKPAIVSWNKVWVGGSFVTLFNGMKKTDRVYTCMPLYHSTAAILGYLGCLVNGTTIIIGRRFSASGFWPEVRATEATIVQYVGEALRYLLSTPPSTDPTTGEDLDKKHTVRLIYGNGLRPDIWHRVKSRFAIESICEFYAATEGHSGSWNYSSNDFSAGAIGRNGGLADFLVGRRLAVVDIDHETETPHRDGKTGYCTRVPRGQPGELLYALDANNISASFQGYFRNSEATQSKVLRDVFKSGDAWFRTGDLIRWDEEGRWFFSDRIGDTFRWRSENVSTSEVAEVLGRHRDVHEVTVYGVEVPHADGRAGCAAIIFRRGGGQEEGQQQQDSDLLREPEPSTLRSLAAHALAQLPKYAVPLFLRVTRELQATGNNKYQKHVLRREGVDMDVLLKSAAGGQSQMQDRIYWLRGDTYVPFEKGQWESVKRGEVKL
ncbi:hypothetical protein AJ80_06135 [Polytolypa hystricis UAMH7299]|uniref:Very long-chain fatty acid transport protein n=1 Tax=Polytolypa hystricis (strain UAMH7299) TaxID=1447883 RepID=A0A2B7XXC5_POLH7|nr:hypothetical protein AJ80_06135 [Polytolypa hystricis UAMH7299]